MPTHESEPPGIDRSFSVDELVDIEHKQLEERRRCYNLHESKLQDDPSPTLTPTQP